MGVSIILSLARKILGPVAAVIFVLYAWWGFLPLIVVVLIELYLLGTRHICRTLLEQAIDQWLEELGFPKSADIRCTIYVKSLTLRGKRMCALMPYCPKKSSHRALGIKKLKMTQGIVGTCARLGEAVIDVLDTDQQQDVESYLVRNWGFTRSEARRLSKDRKAYLALPIKVDGEVIGVLYFDSSDPHAFSQEETVQRIEKVLPFIGAVLRYRRGLEYV